MRVGDIAVGRAGDKGDMLDLTLVAKDEAAYDLMSQALTTKALAQMLNKVVPGPVLRYDLPGLRALKFVLPEALLVVFMPACAPAFIGRKPPFGCCSIWTFILKPWL